MCRQHVVAVHFHPHLTEYRLPRRRLHVYVFPEDPLDAEEERFE
jgi:hypothetical protein